MNPEELPAPNDIECRLGGIRFSLEEWRDVLRLLHAKRSDLVKAFKENSIEVDDHIVVLKNDKCVFYDQHSCVLRDTLNKKPSCCNCIHGLKV